MADRWTLRTPTGDLQLNETFAAPTYQPGGVDTNALTRREGRNAFQRAGDGLPTPGPLRLVGRVWGDSRDARAMLNELTSIRDAVRACTSVRRTTTGGTYTYEGLAGGPTPEVTPDPLGGWVVRLEFWPARAQPAFAPLGPFELIAADTITATVSNNPTLHLNVPAGGVGDLLVLAVASASNTPGTTEFLLSESGWASAGNVWVAGARFAVWYRRAAGNAAYALSVQLVNSSAARAMASVARFPSADVRATTHRSVALTDPQGHWPGNPAWSGVTYLGVYTAAQSTSSPTTSAPMPVQNDAVFATGAGGEHLRIAFSAGNNIDAHGDPADGGGSTFGSVSPIDGLGGAQVAWGLIVDRAFF